MATAVSDNVDQVQKGIRQHTHQGMTADMPREIMLVMMRFITTTRVNRYRQGRELEKEVKARDERQNMENKTMKRNMEEERQEER